MRVSGVGRFCVPVGGRDEVLSHTSSKFVGQAEHELGFGVALCCAFKQVGDVRSVLGDGLAERIQREYEQKRGHPLAHSSPSIGISAIDQMNGTTAIAATYGCTGL